MPKGSFPTPEQILEELADRAATQIDRLAPVAFEEALEELVRYHRFLLALNASYDEEGVPVSFAEVGGISWLPPHREWIRQYRGLFSRAADRVADDTSFITRLAHVPRELLPSDGEFELSDAVLESTVGLVPLLIHRLEAWVTKRTVSDSASGIVGGGSRLALSGSDSKAYEDAVIEIVGSWEGLLGDGYQMLRKDPDPQESDQDRWRRYKASWPFLWQHLQDAAYLLTIAVWNEDRIGANRLRDTLVRWPVTLDSDLLDGADLPNGSLLLPSLFSVDWPAVLVIARKTLPEYLPSPSPDQVFYTLLRNAHTDVTLLTSALLLFWTASGKQLSKIGAETAAAILQRELNEPDDLMDTRVVKSSFKSRFLELVRLAIAGQRHEQQHYGSMLDKFVRTLDQMTERRVVSGRVFTPSTMDERDSLVAPLLAILIAEPTGEGDVGVLTAMQRLAAREDAIPQGDRSLRQLCGELQRYLGILESAPAVLRAGFALLAPETAFDAASGRAQEVMRNSLSAIKEARSSRLRARPVSAAKLERLRLDLESVIIAPPVTTPFFRGFELQTRPSILRATPFDFRLLDGLAKGQLTEPPMDGDISNLVESLSRTLRQTVSRLVWDGFCVRRREAITTQLAVNDPEFWRVVLRLAARVGNSPVLVVSNNAEGQAVRQLTQAHPPSLRIEDAKPKDVTGTYISTIEGIEVYGAQFEPGIAWLFSGRALEAIRYYSTDPKQHLSLDFRPDNDTVGTLRGRVMQVLDWTDAPILEIEWA